MATMLTPEELRQRMAQILKEQMERPSLNPRVSEDAAHPRKTETASLPANRIDRDEEAFAP
jgi:hypothetical protein